jgi:protein phosphatase
VIIYEMLTGHVPYKLSQTRQRHLKSLHEYRYTSARQYRADIPLWLDLALEKATQPNVRLRYQVLSEMLHDLCEPNADMLRAHQHAPLLQRNPIRFWQCTTLILLAIVVIQCYFLLNHPA